MRAVSVATYFLAALASPVVAVSSFALQISLPIAQQQQQQEQQQQKDVATSQDASLQQLLAALPVWTRVALETDDGRRFVSAPMTTSGRLVFRNLTAGSYLGEVQGGTFYWSPLRVDVGSGSNGEEGDVQVWETFRGNDWANRGPAYPRVAMADAVDDLATFLLGPLTLQPKNFYTERSSFSVLSLLGNPMILMGLVGLVMMVGMPYMMDNMDPEMRAEFEAQQKQNPMANLLGGGGGGSGGGSGGPGNGSGGFDMAAFLAGSSASNSNKNQGGRR